MYPAPAEGWVLSLHPTHPDLKNAPSTLMFICPPRPHQRPGISEEPDTRFSGGQVCPSHPYGKGRSPSAALPSANLWVAREVGVGASSVLLPVPTTWARVPRTKTPSPFLPSAAPHVLRLVLRPGPRPRPPLAVPRLPLSTLLPTRLDPAGAPCDPRVGALAAREASPIGSPACAAAPSPASLQWRVSRLR